MKRIIVLASVLFPLLSSAQFSYELDQSIPVRGIDGQALALPWSGGLNAAQYNTMDLNGDAKADLILFDRMSNGVKTFIHAGDHYEYRPEFESGFPTLSNWMIMRDFNCDGLKDIFTGDALGIRVYTHEITAEGKILWQPYSFFVAAGLGKSDVLITKGFSGKINLQLQYDDLPSFVDVDGDGDLDILTFRYAGIATVEYHKNFSMERYGSCDSLEFERITQNWGNFIECHCGVVAFNGAPCPTESGGRVKHSGGKSIHAIDIDNDNDLDVLFSEAGCNSLFLLTNEGDRDNPIFNADQLFPVGSPVDMWVFPVPFFEDVTFDGKNDWIVIPNVFKREFDEVDLNHSNYLYKNSGTNTAPVFDFVKKDFLQSEMIDVGDNAAPALIDLDGDGDLDLVVGHYIDVENNSASLYQYENVGTATDPSFKLITKDYLSISDEAFVNIKPQFVDVNADGRVDLVISSTHKQTLQTKLYTLLNKANLGIDFSGQSFNEVSFLFLFSENIYLNDISGDGLPDLLVGKSNGAIEYWKNDGPRGSLNFSLTENDFLGLGASIERQSPAITIADLNGDGHDEFVFGDQAGLVHIVDNYKAHNQQPTVLTSIIYDPITETTTSKKLGGRAVVTVGNLFNTDRPAILVGNLLGGVYVLRNDDTNPLPEGPSISIYPVPLPRGEMLTIKTDRNAAVQLVSVMGQELTLPVAIKANQLNQISLDNVAAGIYIIRIIAPNLNYTRRIVVY